jgi:tetratricopeptide (TPR) repeat protein
MKLLLVLVTAFLPVLTGCQSTQTEKVSRDLARLHAGAERGDAQTQYELGRAYAEIWNPVEALRWYRKAAEQGIADAQYALGQYYALGEVVPRDNTEAYAWFSLAAAQDHRQAMNARNKIIRQLSRADLDEGNRRAYEYVTRHPAAKGRAAPKVTEESPSPTTPETGAVPARPAKVGKLGSPKDQ